MTETRFPSRDGVPSSGPTDGVSIGVVARETGINPDTIRIWERRYGAPKPLRLPSGHRRYAREEIERLQLVLRLMDAGYRPNEVVASSEEDLLRLLSKGSSRVGASKEGGDSHAAAADWISAARNLDSSALANAFQHDWTELGPLRFIEERVVPSLRRVGDCWAAGELSVSQEHFVSDHLTSFLSVQWRRIAERAPGGPILMASLAGDSHQFGLLMCAVMAAAADHRVVYLGANTPTREIVETSNRLHPSAVCLSLSCSLSPSEARGHLSEIRAGVVREIPIAVGGEGAPSDVAGLHHFETLRGFHRWVRELL